MSEAVYDAEIAPALLAIAEKTKAAGMNMVCTVEYEPEKRADTYVMDEKACLAMRVCYIAARVAPNFDALAMQTLRYCQQHGISTDASMYLSRFGVKS